MFAIVVVSSLVKRTQFFVVFAGYGRGVLVYAFPCVSLRVHEKRPTIAGLGFRSGDIRHIHSRLSRPMTGHTPQKLPFFNAISCIIAVLRAAYACAATVSIVIHAPVNVKPFFDFFNKFFQIFLWKMQIFQISRPPLPGICKTALSVQSDRAVFVRFTGAGADRRRRRPARRRTAAARRTGCR